jgi:hypothetical protein
MFIEYPIIILMFNSQTQHDGAERFQISHKLDKTDVEPILVLSKRDRILLF